MAVRLAVRPAILALASLLVIGSAAALWGPADPYDKLAAEVVLLCGATGIAALSPGSRGVIAPESLLSVLVLAIFCVLPIIQLILGQVSAHHLGSPGTAFSGAALLSLLFCAAFAAGQYSTGRRRSGLYAHEGQIGDACSVLRVRRTRQVVIAYLLVGGISWLAYFAALGGVRAYIDNLQNKTQLASGLGYLYFAAMLFQTGALIAAMAQAAKRPVIPRPMVWAVCAGAFLLILVTGSRSRSVMYLVMLAVQSYVLGHRLSVRRWLAIALFGAFVVYAAGQVRSLGTGDGAILDREAVARSLTDSDRARADRLAADYGHFDRLSLVYEMVPDRLGLQWGRTLASVALVPVPRRWYPQKPMGSGPLLANALRPGSWDLEAGWTSGVTPTFIGELYLNFWWAGVPIGGFIAGAWMNRVYRRKVERITSPWDAAQYALVAVALLMAGVVGEFYGTVIAYAVFAVPLHGATLYAMPRRGSAVAA